MRKHHFYAADPEQAGGEAARRRDEGRVGKAVVPVEQRPGGEVERVRDELLRHVEHRLVQGGGLGCEWGGAGGAACRGSGGADVGGVDREAVGAASSSAAAAVGAPLVLAVALAVGPVGRAVGVHAGVVALGAFGAAGLAGGAAAAAGVGGDGRAYAEQRQEQERRHLGQLLRPLRLVVAVPNPQPAQAKHLYS